MSLLTILHRHQPEEAITLLAIQWKGLSLLTEAVCLLTLLHLHPLLHPGDHILNVAMLTAMAMEWLITMRNTELVLTAQGATMTGVPVPSPLLLHLLLQHLLENDLE